MYINSTPEKCNLSQLPKEGRGSVNNFSCPIQAWERGGLIENVPMSPSGQFFFLKASLNQRVLHEIYSFRINENYTVTVLKFSDGHIYVHWIILEAHWAIWWTRDELIPAIFLNHILNDRFSISFLYFTIDLLFKCL